MWGAVGVGAFAVVAVAGLGVAAVQAQSTARDGYLGLLDGLEFLQDGEVADAQRGAASRPPPTSTTPGTRSTAR